MLAKVKLVDSRSFAEVVGMDQRIGSGRGASYQSDVGGREDWRGREVER